MSFEHRGTCLRLPHSIYLNDYSINHGIVLDNLAAGVTVDEIIHRYPSLTKDAIQASLAYAAAFTR
ncbi:MAG TPA: DUF433 domain-containing protein [Thioploca sp.]|nr:DUF433 domain-containing protein [Thioploca sp.]